MNGAEDSLQPPSLTRWEVKTGDWASKRLDELLAEGYEPFAAVADRQGHVVYLRRHVIDLGALS